MLSCCGIRPRRDDDAHQPLLPQYNADTARQARLREKLHTYQMLRALSQGYMPSNEQSIRLLRTLLSAELLNPTAPQLSAAGRALVRSTRLWLTQLIDLLQAKNGGDQVQDLIWCLSRARLAVDASDLRQRASASKARADTAAGIASLRSVGSLLLANPEFRLFLSDLSALSRGVFRDTALAMSDAARQAGKELDPSSQREQHKDAAPSAADLRQEAADVGGIVSRGVADVAQEAGQSIKEHARGDTEDEHEDDKRAALADHLKRAVLRLRQRPDYADSVAALSDMLRRYLLIYSRAASSTLETMEDEVEANREVDEALRNFWSLVRSLGDADAWTSVEEAWERLVAASRSDPDFEQLVERLSALIRDMLLNPDFSDHAEERLRQVRSQAGDLASESTVGDRLDDLVDRVRVALLSAARDAELDRLAQTSARLAEMLSPTGQYVNRELLPDSLSVFLPVLVRAVQYVPIPRVEVATPAVDILLENLILEPGRTVQSTSFLPFRVHVCSKNDFDVRRARFGTSSAVSSLLSVRLLGLSLAAEDLSYWLRLHSGLLRLADQGIAGFHLDERGVDVRLDVEISRGRLEGLVTLRCVKVRIHRLDYTLAGSRFRWLAWLLKPLVRPILARALEFRIASAVADGVRGLNRELVFARERLRATRIAGPDDLWTFIRAVSARLVPSGSEDVEARVGVRPGLFPGRYAPGSLVRMWEEEAEDAQQRIFEYRKGGWRNEIFGVRATPV